MTMREARLAEFKQSVPKENRPLQILYEDHCGTYIIPYLCQRSDGAWRKVGSTKTIEATVVGWRTGTAILAMMVFRQRLLLALSGHWLLHGACSLSGVKRTWLLRRRMSAFDPKRTQETTAVTITRPENPNSAHRGCVDQRWVQLPR